MNPRPELLSPAGSPEALRAAVQNGADAVYLGLGAFHARRGAVNFSEKTFTEAIRYCHVRGVRVFLTLNTLLTDRELPHALSLARTACRLGVDAVLVQDWGLLYLLGQTLPDLPVHASTQMSVFTTGGARLLHADGCVRIVLARECACADVAAIARRSGAETEIFIHGALCVCYAGQCAMSALIGGRSGNRGRCAQPCRLAYQGDARTDHPLSLKDLSLARHIPALTQMGIDCVKIEGRMRRPEYVALVTGIYARLLRENRPATEEEEQTLALAFSRDGFTDGYWNGADSAEMTGVRPENVPEPKTLFEAARATYEKDNARAVPVRFACTVATGVFSTLSASDSDGHAVCVTGPVPEPARTRTLTKEMIDAQLCKTGGTPYRCERAEISLDDHLSLPVSALNALRRDALAALSDLRCTVPARREYPLPALPEGGYTASPPRFTVSVCAAEQVTDALLALRPARIYLPLEILEKRRACLPELDGGEWCAVLPRVWRDRDEPALCAALDRAHDLGTTGALVGNIGHIALLRANQLDKKLNLYGDFGLNVFNAYALAYLREKGLLSACLSFELHMAQIRDMPKILPTEMIIYGRLPLMITEQRLVDRASGLTDRTGAIFPLLRGYGGRTEIQNSRVLWLADREHWKYAGLAFVRLRFTTESPAECERVFRACLNGAAAPNHLFTRGLYERGVE